MQRLTVLLFKDHNRGNSLSYWENVINHSFAEEGVLRMTLGTTDDDRKQWGVAFPCLARFYHKHFTSGVRGIELHFEQAQEKAASDGSRVLNCPKATLTHVYESGHKVS